MLGMARGKVGDIVFSRRLGQQVTRAYVASVNDAATRGQVEQRGKMGNLVNQYRLLRPLLIKANESKPIGNTDYNRYAHYNLGNKIVPLTKAEKDAGLVVFSTARISTGVLETLQYAGNSNQPAAAIFSNLFPEPTPTTTVGEFWTAFIAANSQFQAGDQILFAVTYGASAPPYTGLAPRLRYKEYTIDITSAAVYEDEKGKTAPNIVFDATRADVYHSFGMIPDMMPTAQLVVQSRKDASGKLLVSTQDLRLSNFGTMMFNEFNTDGQAARVALSYGANESPVLVPENLESNFPLP